MSSPLWTEATLDDVLTRVKRPLSVEDGTVYKSIGIRWYAAGVFLKQAQLGSKIAAKTLFAVEPNDIVYSKLFAWKGSYGVVPQEHRGAVGSNEFPTFRANERLLPEFFAIWASRPEVWDAAGEASTGTTANSRNRLSEDAFLETRILLPPIVEQRQIVQAVRSVDDAAASVQRERDSLDALMVSLRESKITMSDANLVPLDDVLLEIDSGRSPRCLDRPPANGEWGVLKLSAIRPGSFNPAEAKALPVGVEPFTQAEVMYGDVIITRSNTLERVGTVCRVRCSPSNLLLCDLTWRLRFDEKRVDPDYAVFALSSRLARQQIEGVARGTSESMKKISKALLRKIEIPLPDLRDQQELGRALVAIADQADFAAEDGERVRRLRLALVSSLVSGEWKTRSDS